MCVYNYTDNDVINKTKHLIVRHWGHFRISVFFFFLINQDIFRSGANVVRFVFSITYIYLITLNQFVNMMLEISSLVIRFKFILVI